MERNYWLDTLRGLASMWVVLFHLNEIIPFEANFYTSFVKIGWVGVPIFFIISGYCISMVTQRSASPHEFALRRFFRIYPPYYASIVVVLLVIIVRVVTTGTNDITPLPSTFSEIIATLSLMTKPATAVKTVNWVYWSLTYEVAFYLIVTITLFARSRANLIFLFLCLLCFVPGSFETMGKERGPAAVEGIFFLREWLLFASGLGLYEFSKNKSRMGGLLLAVSIIGTVYLKDALVVITSLITLGTIYFSKHRFLNSENLISRIGEYSYSLYLIHVPIGVYLLLQFREGIFLDNIYLHVLYDLVVLVILIGLSYLFYKLVEKPSVLIGKAFLKRNFTLIKEYYAR